MLEVTPQLGDLMGNLRFSHDPLPTLTRSHGKPIVVTWAKGCMAVPNVRLNRHHFITGLTRISSRNTQDLLAASGMISIFT
jgi:hypothetical protein